MKKYIVVLFVILFTALQACKKDNQSSGESQEKKYDVSFNVKGFEQVIESATSIKNKKVTEADPSLHNYYLLCLYYKADGTFIASEGKYSFDEDYGEFKTKLATGNYTAIIFAHGDSGEYEVEDGNIYFFDYRYDHPPGPLAQIYSKRINFSIDAQTNDVVQDVILQRYFSTLALQITDALPSNLVAIETEVKDRGGMNIFDDVTAANSKTITVKSTKQITGQTGTTDYLLDTDLKILNTGGPTEVIITARGTSGIITRKVIPNVNFYKNTKTILRGKLFDNDQTGNGAGFNASFETFLPDSITAGF